jgi:hypothetical protein
MREVLTQKSPERTEKKSFSLGIVALPSARGNWQVGRIADSGFDQEHRSFDLDPVLSTLMKPCIPIVSLAAGKWQ